MIPSTPELIVKAIAIIVMAVILAYALIVATDDARGQIDPLPVSIYDEQLDYLDRQALDIAYRQHVERMFEGWMRDPTGQPDRALTGIRNGRKAYIEAMTAIEARPVEKK